VDFRRQTEVVEQPEPGAGGKHLSGPPGDADQGLDDFHLDAQEEDPNVGPDVLGPSQ